MAFPDFLGIGAQKSGTTWLWRNLQEHPSIWMPERKEIHYFDKLKQHGQDDNWYASLFSPEDGQIAGEITPAYSILDKPTIEHIYRLMPRAKLIFLMRNPVERMWSQAVMYFTRGQKRDIDSVKEEEFHTLLSTGTQIHKRSNYRQTLERWSSVYPTDRIFVGFLEDIHFNPESLIDNILCFLGVTPSAEGKVLREKVHARSGDTIPSSVAIRLAHYYYDDLYWMHESFGGYASFWRYCAERLIQEEPVDPIPYPIWKSTLWEEWDGNVNPQGSPLSEISGFKNSGISFNTSNDCGYS